MAAKKAPSKYAPQENYAHKMAAKGGVRVTLWVHESKAENIKKAARRSFAQV
jgi:CRISPR/Cas system CMR-associated protein Cmr5 small subunit